MGKINSKILKEIFETIEKKKTPIIGPMVGYDSGVHEFGEDKYPTEPAVLGDYLGDIWLSDMLEMMEGLIDINYDKIIPLKEVPSITTRSHTKQLKGMNLIVFYFVFL